MIQYSIARVLGCVVAVGLIVAGRLAAAAVVTVGVLLSYALEAWLEEEA